MKFLSLDPGSVNTGWCLFDTENEKVPVQNMGTTRSKTELYVWLTKILPDVQEVVVEDYIIRQNPRQGGFDHNFDKGKTLRVIGAIELLAWQHNKPVIFYPPVNKVQAYSMLGLKYEKGKSNVHHMDALVHGFRHCEMKKYLPKSAIYNRFKKKG